VDTTEELKQLIEYWIGRSDKDASIYKEWAERVQELDPGDTLADVLRKTAIDHSHRRASIYMDSVKVKGLFNPLFENFMQLTYFAGGANELDGS